MCRKVVLTSLEDSTAILAFNDKGPVTDMKQSSMTGRTGQTKRVGLAFCPVHHKAHRKVGVGTDQKAVAAQSFEGVKRGAVLKLNRATPC